MAGGIFPLQMWDLEPWWRNLFENAGTVQFIHRVTGYVLLVFGLVVWRASRKSPNPGTRRAFDWMAVMLFGQMVLGIVTVLNAAPWYWAILHQFGAVVLIVLVLRARFLAGFPRAVSLRKAST